MSDPCAVCHRPIPEGECHRMVALGMVVHASLLQCGGDHIPEPPERAILQDLIAELQDASTGYDPDCQSGCGVVPGAGCPTHYEQAVERAADRAEQRLQEVSDE